MTSDGGDAAVILTEMAEDRFPAYRAHNLNHYALGKVESGVWSPEEAPRRAAAEMDELLPDGTNTRNHFLYSISDESLTEEVGTLWFAIRETGVGRVVWIYDIEIFDRFRRKGYATRPGGGGAPGERTGGRQDRTARLRPQLRREDPLRANGIRTHEHRNVPATGLSR